MSLNSDRDQWFWEALAEALESSDQEIDEETLEKLEEEMPEITQNVVEELADGLYGEIRTENEDLQEYREEIEGFETRLQDHWGEALDLLENLIFRSFQIGAITNHDHRFEASQEQDYVFEALTHLHARACQTAFEIFTLLKSGYADGALARWRSLHEITATAYFIQDHGQDTAERFLLYQHIKSYYVAQTFQEYNEDLGYEPISDEVLEELEELREQLVDQFEDGFDDNGYGLGWTADALPDQRVSIRKLEEEAGLEHYRPFYKLASESVHADSRGTMNRIGMIDIPEVPEYPQQLLSGPSNGGLSRPAELTAISLNQVTLTLVKLRPSATIMVESLVNKKLLEDVKEVFSEKEQELVEKERETRKEWADMDIVQIARHYLGHRELLTDDFISEYTAFEGLDGFLAAVSLDVETVDDLDNMDPEELDGFVSEFTEFESSDEMIEKAFEVWVDREVDFSEFDVDGLDP